MNVSGDFVCISETSGGIEISCIVAVKEESEMLAGAETFKLVSILSEFIFSILGEDSSIGASDVCEISSTGLSDVREVSTFNSRKFSGRII